MRKIFISSILILSMLLLGSCSLGGSRTDMLNNSSDEEKAKARLEAVIEALENQDKEGLKAMFSEQALSDADDFEGNLDNIFVFYQGKVISWEKSSGPTVFESNDHGHVTTQVSSYYYVTTDKQKYFFLLREYPVDTDHPENVGLYLLLVVKAEDEEKIYDGEQKIMFDGKTRILRAGIYIPFE